MPRRTIVPKYLLHKKSGQAYTYHRLIETPDHRAYLGAHGSRPSIVKFEELRRRIAARMQAELDSIPTRPDIAARPITIIDLGILYDQYAREFYLRGGELAREYHCMKEAVKQLLKFQGEEIGNQYGPKKLREFQKHLAGRYCRRVANKTISRVRRFFRWACFEELIEPAIYERLRSVPPLNPGEFNVRESAKAKPATIDQVRALLPFVSPTVGDMLLIQYFCCMRPSEVCKMHAAGVDRSQDIWLYVPAQHKNEWRGHDLVKAIPRIVQTVVSQRIEANPTGYLFPPAESLQWSYRNRRSAERKTKAYPCELKRVAERSAQRASQPRRRPAGEHYSVDSYRRAVEYGLERAGKAGIEIAPFSPRQLRHGVITYLAKTLSQQKAQRYAGHKCLSTTTIYTEIQVAEMMDVARQFDDQLSSAS